MLYETDVITFIELANKHNVRMLLVGGGAVNFHGYKRHSADVDFWFDTTKKNIANLIEKRTGLETYYESNNIGTVNFKTVARAPHIISITLNNLEAEEYLMLKSKEFMGLMDSACDAETIEPSHVLKALGVKNTNRIIRISI